MSFRQQKLMMFFFLMRTGSVRAGTAIAGCLLVLALTSPVLAASPSAPCNQTGSMGSGLEGCSKPPAAPSKKGASGLLPEKPVFTAPMRFKVRVAKEDWRPEVRRNIAAWVAKKLMPHPSVREAALLDASVRFLSRTGFPIKAEQIGLSFYSVTVDPKILNDLADRLVRAVSSGRLSYRVNRTAVTGGTPNENRFVLRNLPVPPGGVVDAQKTSDTLYAVGQVPGFTRADGIFSPASDPGKTASQQVPAPPQSGTIFSPPPALENLLVHVTPAPTFAGSQIEVDNYGYAPTGALVLNATGNVNNAGVAGGLFTAIASTSFGGMNSGTISYSLPVDLMNRVGVDFNAMNYTLGEGFSPWGHGANVSQLTALGVSGSNYAGDAWASQTFVETPDERLALKETVFLKEFQDTYSPTSQNDRSILGGTLDLSGFKIAGKLTASFDLSDTEYDLTQGSGSDPQNPFYNSTKGLQNYMTGNGQLVYRFTPVWAVALGTVDQQSFGAGVIDPMLQATLGGVSNVMALPTASLFGNDLYVGTLSLTRTSAAKPGIFATSLFFDAGEVSGIGFAYGAMGPGVEESFSAQHWFARADLAVPVGALPTQVLGSDITAMTGGNIGQGGIPLQLWLSAGLRY
ncbi:MAG: ShlB/FhaC/HecB family protein [Leptospirillum sp.]